MTVLILSCQDSSLCAGLRKRKILQQRSITGWCVTVREERAQFYQNSYIITHVTSTVHYDLNWLQGVLVGKMNLLKITFSALANSKEC